MSPIQPKRQPEHRTKTGQEENKQRETKRKPADKNRRKITSRQDSRTTTRQKTGDEAGRAGNIREETRKLRPQQTRSTDHQNRQRAEHTKNEADSKAPIHYERPTQDTEAREKRMDIRVLRASKPGQQRQNYISSEHNTSTATPNNPAEHTQTQTLGTKRQRPDVSTLREHNETNNTKDNKAPDRPSEPTSSKRNHTIATRREDAKKIHD